MGSYQRDNLRAEIDASQRRQVVEVLHHLSYEQRVMKAFSREEG